jgi:hypothetical protein
VVFKGEISNRKKPLIPHPAYGTCAIFVIIEYRITVKPAHVIISIKQLPVLKGHLYLVLS